MGKRLHIFIFGILSYRSDPVFHALEGFFVCDRVGEDDSVSSFVVGLRDILESFLSRGVPDLEFDPSVFNLVGIIGRLVGYLDGFDLEVDSDSGHVICGELGLTVLGEDIGFSDP
jgi:hypothetical protein